ncbi:MAG: hydrogenase maturation protease [Candidatus Thermoplasmatota archaeon]|nr:hydrogenase maturation protease [Euryarchaeota archaeon]MBU4032053.1 hydrogenase maturation protease [Candidatus Thermoplasmatota archaeon]MBU4070679.1 hydrogenase maturation protease [Candidatus Thermoplasmatota archaeon]MBU4143719.1 hydrogenase maturation protease [Candidatus Thermoplasmatota archaeon]MBU4592402.1 hydrogenase maturation protease [Candidatus Thermoplasmatota archaeon]
MNRVAVIGIGNILMSDDGAGVKVLELLFPLPKGVVIIELATGGMTLLHQFDGLDKAIIIDAVDFGGKPGEVRVFKPEDVTSIKTVGYSLHDLDILKVLELAGRMGTLPKAVFIAAIQPASLEMGEGLSPEVEGALPELAARVMKLLPET